MESNDKPAAQTIEVLKDIETVEIENVRTSLNQVYSVWNEMGFDIELQRSRVNTAWYHIQTLVKDICDEEVSLFEEVQKRIKDYTEDISELTKILGMDSSEVVGSTLIEKEQLLRHELDTLNMEKERRMQCLEEFRTMEHNLCELLGVEEKELAPSTKVPSNADLNELQQHVNTLKEEHDLKYGKFCQARDKLIALFGETEIPPETTFERNVLEGKEPTSLSDATFVTLEEILQNAKQRKDDLEIQKKILVDKLFELWETLDVNKSTQEEFLSNHSECKLSNLRLIQQELLRCEELKRENMKSFIDAARQELRELWDKCSVPQSEKELFSPLLSQEITEEILALHKAEAEKWKRYHQETEFILEKIEQRNKLWEQLMSLEGKANDPARFKNRGGNLLKEEKERKKLLALLQTMEKEICDAIEIYEKSGRNFLYLGQDYSTHLREQWQNRTKQKENVPPAKVLQPATPKSAPTNRRLSYYVPKTPKAKPLSCQQQNKQ